MTACVMFAVPTTESIESLQSKLEAVWRGRGLSVSVLQEANSGELTCYLEWWFGTEDQREMVRHVFRLLIDVSRTGEVFYYRSSDIPVLVQTSSHAIRLEEIFSEKLSPTMGYDKEERYAVVDHHNA